MKNLSAATLLSALLLSGTLARGADAPTDAADAAAADAMAEVAEAVEAIEYLDGDEDSDPFELTREDLRSFRSDKDLPEVANAAPGLDRWRAALQRNLASHGLPGASRQLAREYDLPPDAMAQLTRLWLVAEANQYEFDEGSEETIRFRTLMLAALGAAGHAPLAEEIAADAIGKLTECDMTAFDAIVDGSADPLTAAWKTADLARCTDALMEFARRFPDRSTPALLEQVQWGDLVPVYRLSLYAWLASEQGLAHVAEADRPRVQAWLSRRLAGALIQAGLEERAAAMIDGLPASVRHMTLQDELPAFVAVVDGLRVDFDPDRGGVGLSLVAVYLMTGRTAQAEALLATLPDLAEARLAFDCRWNASIVEVDHDEDPCAGQDRFDAPGVYPLILDRLLHDPASDPYPLAEAGFSGGLLGGGTTHPEMLCRFFAEPQYEDICAGARRAVLRTATLDPEDYEFEKSQQVMQRVDGLGLPGWQAHRDAFDADLTAVRERYAQYRNGANWRRREAIEPVAPPFAELALPPTARTSAAEREAGREAPEWPARWADLAPGFNPVRWERSGDRAVAVSLSPLVDPSGEVSAGGYWVHVSDDGGTSWQAPRYTGLAEHFPYVVARTSKLPLFAGDTLQLEVEVAELDTSSITYPPVGLATRRRAKDLFLEIPFAALERDGDGDGITDLVESHLLLDRPAADGGPYIVGSDAPEACANADAALNVLRVQVLRRITGLEESAIVEPVDRAADGPLLAGWRRVESGQDWPLYLKGDRDDFACLPPTGRLMIVYDERQEAELQRRTPDFRLLELPHVVMNRARDRGYVVWSAGWTGGTLRARLVNGEWVIEETSNWIT